MVLGGRIVDGMRSVVFQDYLLSSLGYFAEVFERDGILVSVLGDSQHLVVIGLMNELEDILVGGHR